MEIQIDDKAKQLISIAEVMPSKIPTLVARTPFEYEKVAQFVKDAKAHWNALEAKRKEDKEPYLQAGRDVDACYATALKFCKDAEEAGKRVQLGYEAEQRRIAAEEQRRLEEQARKERETLEAKARKDREEADRKARELEKKAEEARAAGDKAQAVLLASQANKVLEKADAKAENALTKAAQVVAPTVNVVIPMIQGQHNKTVWKAKVVNESLVPREYLMVNEKLLGDYAKAMKDKANVPGIEFYSEIIKSSSSR
jgi:hypothetical protein